jgi:hypothetical protein
VENFQRIDVSIDEDKSIILSGEQAFDAGVHAKLSRIMLTKSVVDGFCTVCGQFFGFLSELYTEVVQLSTICGEQAVDSWGGVCYNVLDTACFAMLQRHCSRKGV